MHIVQISSTARQKEERITTPKCFSNFSFCMFFMECLRGLLKVAGKLNHQF